MRLLRRHKAASARIVSLDNRVLEQRPADAAADLARLDEQPVQVQRARRIAGRKRDDAGDLSVGPGRDLHTPAAMSSEAMPRAAGISAMNPRIIAPHRFPTDTEIRRARDARQIEKADRKC
jgi:hypothetical protein